MSIEEATFQKQIKIGGDLIVISDQARHSVLEGPLTELGFEEKDIKKIVELTGPRENRKYGFTFSDLVQR